MKRSEEIKKLILDKEEKIKNAHYDILNLSLEYSDIKAGIKSDYELEEDDW